MNAAGRLSPGPAPSMLLLLVLSYTHVVPRSRLTRPAPHIPAARGYGSSGSGDIAPRVGFSTHPLGGDSSFVEPLVWPDGDNTLPT